jgi:serine/threonine protein kinase
MSLEQARGKPVDKRTDIWAFGAVLYEMLTGRSLFAAEDVSQTLARVLERQPDFLSLPANLHPKTHELLKICLVKEAKNRCHDMADVRIDIQQVLSDPEGVLIPPAAEPPMKHRQVSPRIVAAVVLTAVTAGLGGWYLKPTPSPERKRVVSFDCELPGGQQFGDLTERAFDISPDGSQFVYKTEKSLYLRSVAGPGCQAHCRNRG